MRSVGAMAGFLHRSHGRLKARARRWTASNPPQARNNAERLGAHHPDVRVGLKNDAKSKALRKAGLE
jgi:hypothetical protein